jgi:hypothetical protein
MFNSEGVARIVLLLTKRNLNTITKLIKSWKEKDIVRYTSFSGLIYQQELRKEVNIYMHKKSEAYIFRYQWHRLLKNATTCKLFKISFSINQHWEKFLFKLQWNCMHTWKNDNKANEGTTCWVQSTIWLVVEVWQGCADKILTTGLHV